MITCPLDALHEILLWMGVSCRPSDPVGEPVRMATRDQAGWLAKLTSDDVARVRPDEAAKWIGHPGWCVHGNRGWCDHCGRTWRRAI